MNTLKNLHRRTLLRGLLRGSAVAMALPLLDVFLDPHGETIAKPGPGSEGSDSSKGLPICFGTWYWGLGLCAGLWEPKQTGADFELNEHLQALAPIKGKFNIFSGTQVLMDGKNVIVHYSPVQGQFCGAVTAGGGPETYGRSLDQDISSFFGPAGAVFPSITVTADGVRQASWSSPGPSTGMNPAEVSPLALYTKMFGASFVDPNAAEYRPDPTIMVRESVLSGVTEGRQRLMRSLPASDRARLDAYFTSVRDLENQLHAQLQKPQPLPSCTKPDAPKEKVSSNMLDVERTHHLFAQLQAHAFSCGLTRVWNSSTTTLTAQVYFADDPMGNHEHTHEDPVDPKLKYQPLVKPFCDRYMAMFTDLVQILDSVKEGRGTLLDRVLIMAVTDHGNARMHSPTELPMLTAGSANGRVRNGLHISAPGDTACRLGLTCQQAVGMPISTWGKGSNQTSKVFSEILV